MKQVKKLQNKRMRRARRTRAKLFGTPARPRLAVHRSNRAFSAQLIDDVRGYTLVSVSTRELTSSKKGSKKDSAELIGELLAKRAKEVGIAKVVFDRRSYAFHGRVSSFAEAARKGGLKF